MATETEAQMCARLRTWAEGLGFAVYPEIDGWDMVLVAHTDIRIGDRYAAGEAVPAGKQVGIHAKLRPSFDVLEQAVNWYPEHRYPAYPFVAVPVAGLSFRRIAKKLGLGVIECTLQPTRFTTEGSAPRVTEWVHHPVTAPPLRLPPIASKCISAGSPSPRVLSRWRVNALRFLAHARARGTVKASDLARFSLGKQYVDRWLVTVDWTTETNKRGKVVRVRTYRVAEHNPSALPDHGYKDVAAELLAACPPDDVEPGPQQLQLAEATP